MAKSGCSAAWLARLNGVQEVVGSNPATPTNKIKDTIPFQKTKLLREEVYY